MANNVPKSAPLRKPGVYVLRLKNADRYYVGSSGDVAARVQSHTTRPQVAWVLAHGGVSEVLDPVTPPEEPLSAWEMRETMARMIMHGFNNVRGWEYCSPQPLDNSDVDGIFKLICGGQARALCHSCGFSGHLSSACTTGSRAVWLDSLMSCRPERKLSGSDVILRLIGEGGKVPKSGKRKAAPGLPSALASPVAPRTSEEMEPTRFVPYDELPDQRASAKRREVGCSRCGRQCHVAEQCFARTTSEGEQIPECREEGCSRCGRQGHVAEQCYARTTSEGEQIPA